MSFQDIIYNNYQQWQVGYTGTISLTLNNYQNGEKYVFKNENIKPDYDEKIEILLALKLTRDKKPNEIRIINLKSKINESDIINNIVDFLHLCTFKTPTF